MWEKADSKNIICYLQSGKTSGSVLRLRSYESMDQGCLKKLTSLESLSLFQSKIPSLGLFADLTWIKIAWLGDVIETREKSSLSFLQQWNKLEKLGLPSNITSETLKQVATLPKLVQLYLSNTSNIDAEGKLPLKKLHITGFMVIKLATHSYVSAI